MRTSVDIPDNLPDRAEIEATASKPRLDIPSIGDPNGPKVASLTREQIDQAMFG